MRVKVARPAQIAGKLRMAKRHTQKWSFLGEKERIEKGRFFNPFNLSKLYLENLPPISYDPDEFQENNVKRELNEDWLCAGKHPRAGLGSTD